ncbi:calcium and integrin-binding protein 1-like [Dysidea avara]|uniref:calcium and integrin-binding protein 1-like n=1 Tax=Dysidea avara TaxID=196820 RepID=UPI00332473AA
MGNRNGFKIRDSDLHELERSIRILNQTEIIHIYKRWHQLYTAYSGEEQLPSPLDVEGFANLEASLPNSYIMNTMDELQMNPFKDRIVKVFSLSGDRLSFEEFLDMVAHFSYKMPAKRKVPIAFRIYDFDDNNIIGREDLKMMMDRLTGEDDVLPDETKTTIIDKVFEEACKDSHSVGLNLFDFKVVLSKSPDFDLTFGFNL